MEEGDVVKVVGLLVFMGGLLAAVMISFNSHNKKREITEQAGRKIKIDRGVALGLCNEFGMMWCALCKELGDDVEAVAFTPVTGQPRGSDKERELWALQEKLIVIDDEAQGLRLCKNHKGMTVRKLRETHARSRADHVAFNAGQREKIDYMDNGGTEKMVLAASKKIRQSLEEDPLAATAPPQLTATVEESIALPVSSSDEKKDDDE